MTEHVKWGAASPFDLVEGGEEGLVRAILDVMSDVKNLPSDGAAFMIGGVTLSPTRLCWLECNQGLVLRQPWTVVWATRLCSPLCYGLEFTVPVG